MGGDRRAQGFSSSRYMQSPAPLLGSIMRCIRDNLDLAELQRAGRGFISNNRSDGVKLHCTGYNAVGAVVSTAFPKNFFETYAEAA
jgi:hypothetical protein